MEEFQDIFDTNSFRGKEDGSSLQVKEFSNDFDETLDFANRTINQDKVAIIKVTVPESTYNKMNHMNLDSLIFKQGTPVIEEELLEEFNQTLIKIEHIY